MAVKEVLRRETDELLHIETGNGDVDATTSHPFYVVGRGWVAAGDLVVGDSIRALSGDVRTVTALRLEKLESPIPVYNLDVEDFDTYFVGSGVLVHNVCVAKEGNLRADVQKGGEPNHFRGHAHIQEGGKRIASIDELGEVVVGKLSVKAKRFVDKYSQQIKDGIKEWYYAR